MYNANNIYVLVDNKVSTINDIVSELTTDIQSIKSDADRFVTYLRNYEDK